MVEILNTYISSTRCIFSVHRIIPAVGEHIGANNALTGGGIAVGIDESMGYGVVVAGLQVIETCFLVVVLSKQPKIKF